MKTTIHCGFQSKTITGKLLACACLLACTLAAGAVDVYTFESLGINTFIDGQDGWLAGGVLKSA